jgi:hypothetical protein
MKTNVLGILNMRWISFGAALAVAGAVQAGDLTGKITFKGTPPPEKAIDASADPFCAQAHPAGTTFTTTHYVVAPDGGFANVFVYIKEGVTGKSFPMPKEAPELDQEGCFYRPYLLGVMTGQPFKIKNSDPTMHNIHALPKVNKEFNFGQAVKDSVTEKKFDKPEVLIRVKCDVHPWMFAFIGVVDHPFFAVSAKDGTFKIPNLPAGKYTLEAVHPKAGVQTQEITVGEGESKANFTFEPKSGS